MNADSRPDPAAHLRDMIAAYGRPRRADVAMIWAYFDETIVNEVSGQDGKRRPVEMFVGGCVSTAVKWKRFEIEWRKALDDEGVSIFHANDFYSFNGEFRWFDRENNYDLSRHNRFRNRLADLILDHVDVLTIFTSMVPIKDKGTRKAYENAADQVFFEATKFRAEGDSSLYIVLARHPELSPWTILKKFENFDFEKKLAGCAVFQPQDVLPLQAADFVLHSVNQRWGGTENPAFLRLKEGCRARNIPFRQSIATTADAERLLASAAR